MCECHSHDHLHTNAGVTMSVILKRDPSRTNGIVRRWNAEFNRKFTDLKRQIRDAVITKDVFGLGASSPVPNVLAAQLQPRQFEFRRSDQKVQAFMDWINQLVEEGLLNVSSRPGLYGGAQPWTNMYIQSAYQQGIARAGQELRKAGYPAPEAEGWHPGMTDPIAVAFNQPFNAERVALIYTRVFNELKGITAAMDQQISRVLAEGMAEGRGPRQIARMIFDRVDHIGLTRARTLARTEIISAHHQATINTYEQWGAAGVRVEAEWMTAGYNVCPICESLAGRIFTLAQIRGMIPAHPNCRCVAIPVLKNLTRNSLNLNSNPCHDPDNGRFCSTGARSFQSVTEAKAYLDESFQGWQDSLTTSERESITHFKNEGDGGGADEVTTNGVLRGWQQTTPEVDQRIRNLDSAIDKGVLPDDVVAYRGAPPYSHMAIGSIYDNPAFTSVSLDKAVATEFANVEKEFNGRAAVYEITLPKGTKAAYLDAIHSNNESEAELLLGRGIKFRITDIVRESGKITQVKVELVSPPNTVD